MSRSRRKKSRNDEDDIFFLEESIRGGGEAKNRFHICLAQREIFFPENAVPAPSGKKPKVGLEPTTCSLRMSCSAIELLRHAEFYILNEIFYPKNFSAIPDGFQPSGSKGFIGFTIISFRISVNP